jgi:hypothetical protein
VAGIVVVEKPPSDWAWEGYEFGAFTAEMLAEVVAGLQCSFRRR